MKAKNKDQLNVLKYTQAPFRNILQHTACILLLVVLFYSMIQAVRIHGRILLGAGIDQFHHFTFVCTNYYVWTNYYALTVLRGDQERH